MQKTKFTIRIEAEKLEGARQYAEHHGTTISRLVSEFFGWLSRQEHTGRRAASTPVLDRLSGLLPADVSEDEYLGYLRQKHGL